MNFVCLPVVFQLISKIDGAILTKRSRTAAPDFKEKSNSVGTFILEKERKTKFS